MWTSVYTRWSYIRMSVCICGTTWWWRRRCIYTHVYVDVYINAYMHMCSMYECWSADANLLAHLQVHVYVQLYLFSYVYLHRYLRLPSYTCSDEFTCIHDVHECIHTHISGVCIAFIFNVFWMMHALDVLLLPVSVSCFGPQQPTEATCSCPCTDGACSSPDACPGPCLCPSAVTPQQLCQGVSHSERSSGHILWGHCKRTPCHQGPCHHWIPPAGLF